MIVVITLSFNVLYVLKVGIAMKMYGSKILCTMCFTGKASLNAYHLPVNICYCMYIFAQSRLQGTNKLLLYCVVLLSML